MCAATSIALTALELQLPEDIASRYVLLLDPMLGMPYSLATHIFLINALKPLEAPL